MAKNLQFGPNGSFVHWRSPSDGRRKAMPRGRTMTGPTFTRPSFSLRFVREGDMSRFMGLRVWTTVSKFQFAASQLYAEGPHSIPARVRGAHLQDLHGGSDFVRGPDGKVYYTGIEAAHYGMGTITRCGEALSESAARQVRLWRSQHGAAENDADSFARNGQLAGYGLAHDTSTYYAPTFINRSEGKLETALQPELSKLLPQLPAVNAGSLELMLNKVAWDVIDLCAGSKSTLVRIIDNRLAGLARGDLKELLQSSSDPDNYLFKGSERNFLEEMRDDLKNGDSRLQKELSSVVKQTRQAASDLTEVAEGAKAERAEAKASEGGSSQGGGAGPSE
jgi:hypothetical protein